MFGTFVFFFGYPTTINKDKYDTDELIKIAHFDKGVNGYFYAGVHSQTFKDVSHAVIVDMDLNIVHDPNPNQKALLLKPEDITDILVMHDMIIGKTGKLFTLEEWDNATEKERYENTHRINE